MQSKTDPPSPADFSSYCIVPAKEIRKLLHLAAGTALRPAVVGNRLELTPVELPGPKPKRKSGLMVVPRSGKPFDALGAINAVRDSRP